MFKFAIEVCFENYFGLIHTIFLLLGSTKSVYFFWRHPVVQRRVYFRTFVDFSLRKGMLFGNIGQRMSNFGKEPNLYLNFGPENAIIWQFLSTKRQLRALLIWK